MDVMVANEHDQLAYFQASEPVNDFDLLLY